MSKSCSDKLALKQVTGLLSGITAQLVQVDGCYLRTLVMPEAETVNEAVKRAFGREGRLKVLNDWEGTKAGHQFRPFDVRTTKRKFAYSAQGAEAGGSNLSALWTPKRQEVLVNGVLQGRKQFDVRGASITSRRGLWKLALEVAIMAGVPAVLGNLDKATYGQAKESSNLNRKEAKEKALEMALTGWKRNERDDDWGLEPQ
jgi:tRNA-specific adenosine deaminase 1